MTEQHEEDRPTKRRPNIVVIGDVVLDREFTGQVDRISPDAPVPVLDVTAVRQTPGGAGLTAVLVATGGAAVTFVAPIGDDRAAAALRDMLGRYVEVIALGHVGPTRRKTRLRSVGQSLLRMDDGGPGTPTTIPTERLRAVLRSADVVLVSERDIESAVAMLVRIEKSVVEGAGAAGLAAMLSDPARYKGKKVGTLLCGGNIDTHLLANVLVRDLVRQGRIARLRVAAQDQPGALAKITAKFFEGGVNIIEIRHSRIFTALPAKDTVIEVECLGACGFATPIMVNEEFIESVTPEKVSQVLSQFK